jgi:hypothetical protein
LRGSTRFRHHEPVEDEEATTLMLEALFDIKAAVYDIHQLIFWIDEDEDGEEELEEDDA